MYQEIPFVNPGYSLNGCHCWGLVWLVYYLELKIELGKYTEYTASQVRQSAKTIGSQRFLAPWVPVVGTYREFDVLVMSYNGWEDKEYLGKVAGHVGIISSPGYVLHVEEGINSVNMRLTDARIRNRQLGAYRHESMI